MPKITINLPDSVLASLRERFPALRETEDGQTVNCDPQTVYAALADVLARYGVEFPTPKRGGKRPGAGAPKRSYAASGGASGSDSASD